MDYFSRDEDLAIGNIFGEVPQLEFGEVEHDLVVFEVDVLLGLSVLLQRLLKIELSLDPFEVDVLESVDRVIGMETESLVGGLPRQ
jgi:hypothetical protein